jgi:hypothetical protein
MIDGNMLTGVKIFENLTGLDEHVRCIFILKFNTIIFYFVTMLLIVRRLDLPSPKHSKGFEAIS